jgi:hypothetical protein
MTSDRFIGVKPSTTQSFLTGECLVPRRFSPTADPRCFASLRCMVIVLSGSASGRMTAMVRLDVNRRACRPAGDAAVGRGLPPPGHVCPQPAVKQ